MEVDPLDLVSIVKMAREDAMLGEYDNSCSLFK